MIGKLTFLFLVVPGLLLAQSDGDYRTDQAGGNWGTATTWQVFTGGSWQQLETAGAGIYQNIIPTSASGAILVQNNITVAASVTADQLTVASGITLTISATRILTIADGAGDDLTNQGTITVTGTLVFDPSATYRHARDGGAIPLATWGANSTCYVSGITASNPTLNSTSAYQNFTWDCSGQTATRTLAGNLRTVNANLDIINTGGQQLQFATNQTYTLNIAGDFSVSGTSRIAFATSGVPTINLTGDFNYSSTGSSTLKTTGTSNFTVGGGFTQSSGTLTLSSGNNTSTINVGGDFSLSSGTMTRSGGTGVINFNGTGGIQNVLVTGTMSSTINVSVSNTSGVSLASDVSLPSNLTQASGAGDIDLNGNALTVNGTFSQVSGAISVNTTAEFILQGSGTLPGAVSFSGTDLLRLEINQTGTLSTTSAITITNLNLLNGAFSSTSVSMATGGQITRLAGTISATPSGTSYNVLYTNTAAINTGPELPASATVLNNLTKQGAGTTTLNQASLTINGNLTTSAGTFACGANSISLGGNFISNGTFTTTAGGSFTFTGPSATLSGATAPTFVNLTVNGSLTPSVSYGVNGNYTVGGGATVNAGSGTVTFGGTTIITNGGTMNLNAVTISAGASFTAPSNTMGIAGNFAITNGTSTFTHNSGTILFNGTTVLSGTATKIFNNVTVSGALSATGTVAWQVNGTLTDNGTVNFSGSSGNTTFGGTCSLTGSGTTSFGPVVISTGNTLTTSKSFSMTTLNINSTATLTANANFSMTGNFTGTGNFSSTATVTFAGGTTSMTGAGTKSFTNITVNNGATFSPTVGFTILGDLTVNGSLADPNNTHTIIFDGTTTISGSPTSLILDGVTINATRTVAASCDLTIDNTFAVAGSFSSSATVTFTGVTMSGTGTKSFTNLTVGTGTFTPNADYSISSNLVVTGTLAGGTGTTTFNGNTTISGAGAATFNFLTITGTLTSSSGTISVVRDFTNNGTFNHNSGTVSFSTTGTNQIQILGSNSIVFNNIVINNVGVATDVINSINGGQTVDVAGALSFGEANAVIDADGSGGTSVLRFLSTGDSPANDGRVAAITFAGSSISGNINVQRFVSSENRIYRYISSPVVGATVAQLKAVIPVTGTFTDPSDGSSSPPCTGCNTTNPSLFSYNESTAAYVAFPASGLASASTFTNGRGYSTFFRHTGLGAVGQVTLNFTGTHPSTAGVTLPVSPTSLGYSLVGNPYPSPIVWNNGTGWTKTNINDVIVVRDNATGLHQSYSAAAGSGIIAPGQSFWVQSSAAGASLQVNENAKTSGTYSFYKTTEPIIDQVELLLTKVTTGTTDNARIVIVNGSLQTYDAYDAFKFDNKIDDGGAGIQVQDISTTVSTSALAVNSIPSITCGQTFNVKVTNFVNSGESVNYTLIINPSGSMKPLTWILHDNYTNTDINVSTNPTYNFSVNDADAASKSSSRFTLTAQSAPTLDVSKPVTAVNMVCSGSEAIVTIASQDGFTYGAEINGIYYPNLMQGNGADISLFIENDKLNVGSNTIKIKANSGCDQQFLTTTVSVSKESAYGVDGVIGAQSCKSGSFTLMATSSQPGAILKWYPSAVSTSEVFIGQTFSTPMLSSTTTYYVSAVSPNGCESERMPVVATIINESEMINVDPVSPVCKGESALLSVSSTSEGGEFKWYNSQEGGQLVGTGPVFETSALQGTTKYYVSYAGANFCESDRKEVIATISEYSPSISVQSQNQVLCPGSSHLLTASGAASGATYLWYTPFSGNEPVSEGTSFNTGALIASSTFYLAAKNPSGCISEKIPVMAQIDSSNPSMNFTANGTKSCENESASISLSGGIAGSTYNWYSSLAGGDILATGPTLKTDALSDNRSYFVSVTNANGCESTTRKEITVQVTKFTQPKIDATTPGLLISNSVTGNQWYFDDKPISGATSQNFTPKESGSYSLKVTVNGCTVQADGTYNIVTSLEDEPKTINVFPNPVSEVLHIFVAGSERSGVQLFDEKGAIVGSTDLLYAGDGWAGDVDVRHLGKGLYFLRIISETKAITHKVIIK